MVKCCIGDVQSSALWDTGAQISMLCVKWLKENGIEVSIRDLSELLDSDLEVSGVNGSRIPYEGYIELPVQIKGRTVKVPFLVTKDDINTPIIGFNVIKTMLRKADGNTQNEIVRAVFEGAEKEVDNSVVNAFVATVQDSESESMSPVKVLKSGVTVKGGKMIKISCKINSTVVNDRTPVVFEPETDELLPQGLEFRSALLYLKKGNNTHVSVSVVNTSERDDVLHSCLIVGDIHQVTSVTPVQAEEVDVET